MKNSITNHLLKRSFGGKNFFLALLLILFSSGLFAQQNLPSKIYARPYKDSIALRWQIYNAELWKKNIKKGYDLYRKNPNGEVQKLNDSTIKALPPRQFAMRYFKTPKAIDTAGINENNEDQYVLKDTSFSYNPDSVAMKAMILQFPEEVGMDFQLPAQDGNLDFGTNKDALRWLFHSITCLSSKEAAIVSGLYFTDKKVKRNENYTYYLTTAGEGINKAIAQISVSPSDPYPIRKPEGMKDNTNKRRAVMTWKKADTSIVYLPTYNIFRSESKNGKYIQMNKEALLAVYSGVLDSTIVSFNDSTLTKGKIYYYKVKGMDLFGETTPFSDPYVVTEKTLMEYAPYIDEARKIKGNPPSCRIQWKIEPKEEENVAHFKLYRSHQPDTLFLPLTNVLKKDQRSFIDKSPSKNNYYKVMMVGNAGDTLWSTPGYVLVPDSIPPGPAVMQEAICDSLGVVTITWKNPEDTDLHSFKLYRANYSNEEFSRVGTIERIDTIYRDTISLNTLTEQVYYKILAYDDSYNPSEFSNVIKAKRYDIIPPNHPVFTTLRSDTSGIQLTWGNSSSTDVIKTVLYRKLKGEISWHDYKTFARDTSKYTSFTDKNTYKGQWYEYTLRCFDDDKLVSEYAPVAQLRAFDDGFRPPILKITSKTNVKKHTVKLAWEYPHSGVQHFQIYKAKNQEKMSILISLQPGIFEFYDKEVGSGNQYRYILKAVFKDGGESPFSREIVVQF